MHYFNEGYFEEFYFSKLYLFFLERWLTFTLLLLVSSYAYWKFFSNKSSAKKVIPTFDWSVLTSGYVIMRQLKNCKRTKEALGEYLKIITGICHVFDRERIFKGRFGYETLTLFYKPETVQVILKDTENIDKIRFYDFFKPYIGNGLICSSGKKWHYNRKLLDPSFYYQNLRNSLPVVNKHSSQLVSKLQRLHSSWVDIVPMADSSSINIIIETTTGLSSEPLEELCNEYRKALHIMERLTVYRFLRPWFYSDFTFSFSSSKSLIDKCLKSANSLMDEVIKRKMVELKEKGQLDLVNEKNSEENQFNRKAKRNLLDFMIKQHLKDPLFSMEDIKNEAKTIISAGHETTSYAISYTLYCIGLDENRNFQNEIHQELDKIFFGDIEREISWEDVKNMKYLECVIKESMRLYPPVPCFGRKVTKNFTIGDYTIERDSSCLIIPMMLHRDPVSFPNPEKFDPERFFPENVKKRHPYAYVPFSAGLRNCIGYRFALLETKVLLAQILRNFTVTSKDPRDKIRVGGNIVLLNLDEIQLKFTPRCVPSCSAETE